MMKIANSESIWATSIQYLNDVSEQEHYIKLIRARIPHFLEWFLKRHPDDDKTMFDLLLNDSQTWHFTVRPFVASFSRLADSLPQWRSYCQNGNGVSIGFKVDCLKRAYLQNVDNSSLRPTVMFNKVDYNVENLDAEIYIIVDAAKKIAEMAGNTLSLQNAIKFIAERFACFNKHPSFSQEKEFRIIVDAVFGQHDLFEFRQSPSSLIPYVVVSIPRHESGHSKDPVEIQFSPLAGRWQFIDRVVIGPTPNKELSQQAVEAFFRKLKLHVEVATSDVPYRDL